MTVRLSWVRIKTPKTETSPGTGPFDIKNRVTSCNFAARQNWKRPQVRSASDKLPEQQQWTCCWVDQIQEIPNHRGTTRIEGPSRETPTQHAGLTVSPGAWMWLNALSDKGLNKRNMTQRLKNFEEETKRKRHKEHGKEIGG